MTRTLPIWLQSKGIYYGYIALFAGTLGMLASLPGQTMGISVFTTSLVQSYQVDRLTLSLMYLFGTLSSAFFLPYAGRLLDRFGARYLAFFACLGLLGFLILLGIGPKLSQFLVQTTGLSPSLASMLVLFLCFFGIRHFGQGQLTLACRTMMGRWFEAKRGLVLGVSGVFIAFGFGGAPYFLNAMIDTFSWSQSLWYLAIGLGVFSLFALVFFRDSPEKTGLMLDGVSSKNTTPKPITGYSAAEAKRTFIFWVFNIGVSVQALIVSGITFNMADIGLEQGLSSQESFQIFIFVSFVAVISQLVCGYLSDKFPMKIILILMQLSLASSLIALSHLNHPVGFAVAALSLGISNGAFSLVLAAAWPKLFGRAHLGAINGIASGWMVGSSALGPYIISQGQVLGGQYETVLALLAILPLCVAFAAFFANPPKSIDSAGLESAELLE